MKIVLGVLLLYILMTCVCAIVYKKVIDYVYSDSKNNQDSWSKVFKTSAFIWGLLVVFLGSIFFILHTCF